MVSTENGDTGKPLSKIVKEPTVRELTQDVSCCPGYQLLTRKTIPKNHIEICEEVKNTARKSTSVHLTTESWTLRNSCSFLSMTAHYLDDDTHLKSHMIPCKDFLEKDMADNRYIYLKNILNKVTAV